MVTQCPNCKANFKARDDWKGKETKCPKCQQVFTLAEYIPEPNQAAPTAKPAVKPSAASPPPRAAVAPAAAPAQASVQPAAATRAPAPGQAPAPASARAPRPAPSRAYARPESREMSDTVYVYSVLCALVISVVSLFLGQICMREKDRAFEVFGSVLMVMGVVTAIYSAVVQLVMYYKMWAAIQDGNARMGPGKAVGLLLVPVADVFWAVYMFVGFAGDYNAFAERHSIRAEKLSKGLMLQYSILWVFIILSFIVLYVLPEFGMGKDLFGYIYASWGRSTGLVRFAIQAWKLLNIGVTIWVLIVYTIVSSRICRGLSSV